MKQQLLAAVCFASIWGTTYAVTSSEAMGQAQQLLAQGDAVAAYQMLAPYEDSMAGEPSFDLLFGRAALGANQQTRAALAFERCLAVQPRNGDCRLGMAQAHMSLGEVSAATTELNTIKKSAPPAEVARLVEHYLGLLAANKTKPQRLFAWAELNLGYDDNINVAPTSSTVTLPGSSTGSGVTFSNAADDSLFGQASVGVALQIPMGNRWTALAGVTMQGTNNFVVEDNSPFDTNQQISGYVGASGLYGRQRFGVMLQGQNYQLSGENYRNIVGLVGQYSYVLSPRTQLSSFLQQSQLNYQYANNNGLQDLNSTTLGVSVMHSLWQNRVLAFAGGYAGLDRKIESAASENINSDFYGLRAGASWLFASTWQLGYSVLFEQRDYQGTYQQVLGPWAFDYKKEREDRLFSQELSLEKKLSSKLKLQAKYNLQKNHSNINVRDYDRQQISLGARYDFF